MRMPYASVTPARWSTALALVVAAFLAFSLPPYFAGESRVPPTFALHYPLLVAHVMLGSLAMVAAVVQIWPQLRTRRRALHRSIGHVYVWAAIPAAVCAMVIGAATPFGPFLAVSNVMLAALWLWFTVNGFVAARQRRFAHHRRHMARSATLALSTITNRMWTPLLFIALEPLQHSMFGGNPEHFLWFVAGLGAWLGWTIPLVTVQWWLTRKPVMARSSISRVTDEPRV
ncbi:DUF2306 domain-containing protein [Mycobacterium deserti]|uniref:DUF2306 domain-containing protein n=1 Tax=Mycobacterium deserti TaxID=2978347 RepID=A0ABT2M7E7_9MYCO|nr:DUF2306 domain-containing protein [Mycobacterium deserti]MCT7658191.1 DUF2306 domain-containing protein [Mycobacterium deserti]